MSSTLRRRGGQPGNRNALKHGAYSINYNPADPKDSARVKVKTIQKEIDLLRGLIRRFAAGLPPEPTFEENWQALRLVSFSAIAELEQIGVSNLKRAK